VSKHFPNFSRPQNPPRTAFPGWSSSPQYRPVPAFQCSKPVPMVVGLSLFQFPKPPRILIRASLPPNPPLNLPSQFPSLPTPVGPPLNRRPLASSNSFCFRDAFESATRRAPRSLMRVLRALLHPVKGASLWASPHPFHLVVVNPFSLPFRTLYRRWDVSVSFWG